MVRPYNSMNKSRVECRSLPVIATNCDERKETLACSFPPQDANAPLAYDGC